MGPLTHIGIRSQTFICYVTDTRVIIDTVVPSALVTHIQCIGASLMLQ